MKIISYNRIVNPSFLLINHELPSNTFHRPRLISALAPSISSFNGKKKELIIRLPCCFAARAALSSSSLDSSSVKTDTYSGSRKEKRSSFYTHPSLLEMGNEKAANRERVYEFLRGIVIVPDELDGLELPVTVEVMRERVDFLQKLGLTIEDINNYPLILGCSVKKNMIPVLDYLGRLGVRKSTLTDFLRRYPQVLHASVVVDLAPVVKYLQGMDIKPNDIPRVVEKYPEVFGFKLEGTMSTSVAYLVGIGVARREIGGVLTRYPEILGMRVGRVIKPFVEYLEILGIPRLAVASNCTIPRDLRNGPGDKTSKSTSISQFTIESTPEDFGRVVEKMPQIISLSKAPVVKHVDFLKGCGFSSEQVREMVVGCPQVLALNLDIMNQSFEYFNSTMARPMEDLVAFPAFFTYGLESTIKPRHKRIAEKGLKCSLAWLLNCTDEKFDQRMSYDFIDMEEMEAGESSFDMNTPLEPRNDESASDYDEDYSEDDNL
ncbi:transcription termination factor mterf4, chloroplastic [Nicotiana attenuata]|uniref:Transcription termination factor mterf4, chloroplastic n=1 Tax=Nicotiana attenuata TaxID=49451 RepID=A0A1J6I536_NICAT|nr:transcription termination factor mterf4, chloroplastic [Nicotiana attenuata]